MFAIGAVPTTALTFAVSHDLTALAGAAIVGGIGFRPLVNVLDGKSLPTLPLGRKEVDVAPTIGPDVRTPGEFGLWIGEATGRLPRSATRPDYSVAPTSRSTCPTPPKTSPSSAKPAPAKRRALLLFPKAASVSEGHTASMQRERLLTAQTFRALAPDHAVALLTVGGTAFDDVVWVPQFTTDDLEV